MGGRGGGGGSGGGGSGGGKKGGNSPFKIPKMSKAKVSKMSRSELESWATAIYANNAMKSGLSKADGVYRAKSLMSGNTTAQLRKYVTKYGK